MAQLNNKDQLVHQLKKNMEKLHHKVEKRDQKRDKSQQKIKQTLSKLEGKLDMFTKISAQNQGGLAQISQGTFGSKRVSLTNSSN